MQKLVSKNPIQRFKQGKRILKAHWGDILLQPFGFIYKTEKERPLYETGTVEYDKGKLKNKSTKDLVDAYSKDMPNYGYNQEQYTQLLNLGQEAAKKGQQIPDLFNYKSSPFYIGYNSIIQNNKSKIRGNQPKIIQRKPVNNYYLKGFENRKTELAQQGKTVRDIQKMLGFTEGNGLDGKWGQNTEDAYVAWLNQQKANQEAPVVEKPTDITAADAVYNKSKDNAVYSFSGKTLPTPDYGYYSPSSYGTLNPRWIKTAGATNIEGFRNLVNTNSQLKNDLLNRYGENWEQYLFDAAGVNANKRHFGRKSRRLINNALQNVVNTLNDNYMDKVRAYDQQYGLYKQGGQLVSRNPITRFKNKKK